MKYIKILFVTIICILSTVSALSYRKLQIYKISQDYNEILSNMQRKDYEPEGMEPEKLFDYEYNYTKELGEYHKLIMENLSVITKLPSYPSSDPYDISGEWQLKDFEGSSKNVTERWSSWDCFDIFNKSKEKNASLNFYSYTSYSPIYEGKGGELYIIPTWYCGTLKQLCLLEDRIYIYVLCGDEWVLDPIHEGGKNYYKKVSRTVTNVYP